MLSAEWLKMTVEAALDAKIGDHMGYAKHDLKAKAAGIVNGISRKRLKGDHGENEVSIDRPWCMWHTALSGNHK